MFQTFARETTPDQGPPRLALLRAAMKDAGIDALLVPREDAWAGEYVAPRDARLAWLTGFTGSAGFAVVLADQAAIFVDGRYRVQVRAEVAPEFTPVNWPEVQLADWLTEALDAGAVVAFDPWLHGSKAIGDLTAKLKAADIELAARSSLIDPLWEDQPAAPTAAFEPYPIKFAGQISAEKREAVAAEMTQNAAIITAPDSIAWLLNIRGRDIARNPVPHAFAILHKSGNVDLFAGPGKARAVAEHMGEDVSLYLLDDLQSAVEGLGGPVLMSPGAPHIIRSWLDTAGIEVVIGKDPCSLPKACKSEVEIAGSEAAHERDAVAMVKFLAWLEQTAQAGGLSEIDVVTALEGFRRETNQLLDISFDTICGAGGHGAIVHYRVTEDTNAHVKTGALLLVDSGGQYVDGTTDITRTVTIGTPPEDAVRSYTAVLQGMIAVSRARFPKGVAGRDLDALARTPLWALGRDYDHGTGHGVGVYLCVHEGPQGISRRNMVPLKPGMILSNEPGYYREGEFGIRIENLLVVRPAPEIAGQDAREMMVFETLTWVPLDRRLIDVTVLTVAERVWVDDYHAGVLQRVEPHVDGDVATWLRAACAPL